MCLFKNVAEKGGVENIWDMSPLEYGAVSYGEQQTDFWPNPIRPHPPKRYTVSVVLKHFNLVPS